MGREGREGAWLVRDGDVLAAVELTAGRRDRMRGLLGRTHFDGALVIRPCKQVHTLGMRFAIDVAFCNSDGVVLHMASLRPWRISRIVRRSAFVVEAPEGAFERWRLRPLDVLEVKE